MRKEFFSELVSTFVLIFFSCGSMAIFELYPIQEVNAGLIISFTFTLSIASMIYLLGSISGAHMNPAVTIVMFFSQRLSLAKTNIYILAQLIGASLASGCHVLLLGRFHDFGATRLQVSYGAGFLLETFMSFALMGIIILCNYSSFFSRKLILSLTIGSTVGLCAYFGGPMTNASMNPTRSLVPMIFTGDLSNWELYFFAPILGMLLSIFIFKKWWVQKDF